MLLCGAIHPPAAGTLFQCCVLEHVAFHCVDVSWQNIATLLIIHNTMSTFSHMRLNICNGQLFRLPANYLPASNKLSVWHYSNAAPLSHILAHTHSHTLTKLPATYQLLSNFARKCDKVSNTASGKMTCRAQTLLILGHAVDCCFCCYCCCNCCLHLLIFMLRVLTIRLCSSVTLHSSLLTFVRFLLFVEKIFVKFILTFLLKTF